MTYQPSELEHHGCENDHLPVNSEPVWDLLLQLDLCKFLEPDEVQLRILKELADVNVSASLNDFWSIQSLEMSQLS